MPHLFGRYLQIRMNEVARGDRHRRPVVGTGGFPALLPRLHAQRARPNELVPRAPGGEEGRGPARRGERVS